MRYMSSNTDTMEGNRTTDSVAVDARGRPGRLTAFFCDCGGLLVPGDEWTCQACNASSEMDGVTFSTTTEQTRRELSIVTDRFFRGPKTSATCPECGHDEAYFLLAQLRSADESGTQLLTCAECEHNWREDD